MHSLGLWVPVVVGWEKGQLISSSHNDGSVNSFPFFFDNDDDVAVAVGGSSKVAAVAFTEQQQAAFFFSFPFPFTRWFLVVACLLVVGLVWRHATNLNIAIIIILLPGLRWRKKKYDTLALMNDPRYLPPK